NPQLRADAVHSLVALGFGLQVFHAVGPLFRQNDMVAAVLTLDLYPQAPDVGRELLVESMASRNPGERATAFWVAGVVNDPQLIPDLQAGLSDSMPEGRMAATWGLGNLGGDRALVALRQTARDGNDEVEAFAQRAIQRIALGAAPAAEQSNRRP